VTAYYNEIDPGAAAWLRELIKQGHIADGVVDERSIEDVLPSELREFRQCHFFAGIGVWSYALQLAGWGDDRPVWTGSCPCQPFSRAGQGAGFADERHLWPAFHHLIRECRPVTIFGEQVEGRIGGAWIDLVHSDLEADGYAVGAVVAPAAGFGAPHIRSRMYWVAYPDGDGCEARRETPAADGYGDTIDANGGPGLWATNTDDSRLEVYSEQSSQQEQPPAQRSFTSSNWRNVEWLEYRDGKRRPTQPGTFPLVDGAPARVVRLRGYGNAIVAPQAAEFIKAYREVTEV